jgi:hypothetical protein
MVLPRYSDLNTENLLMVCRRFLDPASAFVRRDTTDGSGFGHRSMWCIVSGFCSPPRQWDLMSREVWLRPDIREAECVTFVCAG